ncbi:hypothetical protein NMY22_g1273 [Coprinellus aureogranulatus]|nr:hypothetical protein NMY22_g1273 [Coprinellus aureogranulatus]
MDVLKFLLPEVPSPARGIRLLIIVGQFSLFISGINTLIRVLRNLPSLDHLSLKNITFGSSPSPSRQLPLFRKPSSHDPTGGSDFMARYRGRPLVPTAKFVGACQAPAPSLAHNLLSSLHTSLWKLERTFLIGKRRSVIGLYPNNVPGWRKASAARSSHDQMFWHLTRVLFLPPPWRRSSIHITVRSALLSAQNAYQTHREASESEQEGRSRRGRCDVVLVIHGGAGTMSRQGSTPEQRKAFRKALSESLKAGYEVLKDGGEAMDAAVAAVSVMEGKYHLRFPTDRVTELCFLLDNPLFNAGKGAVFNTAGKNELEASIMLSEPPSSHPSIPPSRRGLGLTLLTRARNPSKHARALYLRPDLVPHTFISGAPAEDIAASLGEEIVDPAYFFTEHRWREHRRGLGLPEEPFPSSLNLIDLGDCDERDEEDDESAYPIDLMPKGTVGAVALDVRGCVAAVTSTGGRTNKLPGRIGDTPLMGAGFWAEEWDVDAEQGSIMPGWLREVWKLFQPHTHASGKVAVGVSGTGDGDYFIRQATASTIARRMQLAGQSLSDASEKVVQDLFEDGGVGGVIALDNRGNVALPLNCPGMYRGVIRGDGVPKVAIFREDELEEVRD